VQHQNTNHKALVADLAAYRKTKTPLEQTFALPRLDAEETITEIAKYVLLIVDAITRHRH
jgi:hypothetical protein